MVRVFTNLHRKISFSGSWRQEPGHREGASWRGIVTPWFVSSRTIIEKFRFPVREDTNRGIVKGHRDAMVRVFTNHHRKISFSGSWKHEPGLPENQLPYIVCVKSIGLHFLLSSFMHTTENIQYFIMINCLSTTKPTRQGTGLGLSLCYDILKAQGGEIKVNT